MPLEATQTAARVGWTARKDKETIAYIYMYIYTSMHMYILCTSVAILAQAILA